MKNWWKTLLQMAMPLVHAAGQAKRDEDENDTGTDDIIGFAFIALSDIGNAALAGDVAKIKAAISKADKNINQ